MKNFLKLHLKLILFFSGIVIFFIIFLLLFHVLNKENLNVNQEIIPEEKSENLMEEYVEEFKTNNNTYIKWVDFKGTSNVLNKLAVRAVKTIDFMTAEAADLPWEVLQKVMSRIINEVRGVNRVFYDLTSKPPGTVEFE